MKMLLSPSGTFGSAVKFDYNPDHLPREKRDEGFAGVVKIPVQQLVTEREEGWHRWFGTDWHLIEICRPIHGATVRSKAFSEKS